MREAGGEERRAPEGMVEAGRVCFVDPDGPLLTIRVTADGEVRSRARFLLFPPGHRAGEAALVRWEIDTGEDGRGEHTLAVPPDVLDEYGVSYVIRACGRAGDVESGTVRVDVLQDGEPCALVPEATFPCADLPACEADLEGASRIEDRFIVLHSD